MKDLNKIIVKKLIDKNKTISFMESCTGGFLANEFTNVNGSSKALKVSLITYSNEYKMRFGVSKNTLDKYTVYSMETANEMAKNVSEFAKSDYGIGVTGEFANSVKEENKVYYSIYDAENNKIYNNVVFVKPKKRSLMKEYVAKIILEELWNILMKN